MKKINGDLIKLALNGEFDVIIHGCNCFCVMGKGIAKQIRDTFPSAYEIDQNTQKGSILKLGTYTAVEIITHRTNFIVVNGYTQYDYRGPGPKIDYNATSHLFQKIKHDFAGKRIGYPKIGAGLAGGDWSIIEEIIDRELEGEDHTLVYLN